MNYARIRDLAARGVGRTAIAALLRVRYADIEAALGRTPMAVKECVRRLGLSNAARVRSSVKKRKIERDCPIPQNFSAAILSCEKPIALVPSRVIQERQPMALPLSSTTQETIIKPAHTNRQGRM